MCESENPAFGGEKEKTVTVFFVTSFALRRTSRFYVWCLVTCLYYLLSLLLLLLLIAFIKHIIARRTVYRRVDIVVENVLLTTISDSAKGFSPTQGHGRSRWFHHRAMASSSRIPMGPITGKRPREKRAQGASCRLLYRARFTNVVRSSFMRDGRRRGKKNDEWCPPHQPLSLIASSSSPPLSPLPPVHHNRYRFVPVPPRLLHGHQRVRLTVHVSVHAPPRGGRR